MKKVMFQISIPVSILREGKKFVAYTPALDLSTSANSYAMARQRFQEIVKIFFEETLQRGTIEETLESLGWSRIRAQWTPPLVISQEIQSVKLPALR